MSTKTFNENMYEKVTKIQKMKVKIFYHHKGKKYVYLPVEIFKARHIFITTKDKKNLKLTESKELLSPLRNRGLNYICLIWADILAKEVTSISFISL